MSDIGNSPSRCAGLPARTYHMIPVPVPGSVAGMFKGLAHFAHLRKIDDVLNPYSFRAIYVNVLLMCYNVRPLFEPPHPDGWLVLGLGTGCQDLCPCASTARGYTNRLGQ